jgi:hypothetical protein
MRNIRPQLAIPTYTIAEEQEQYLTLVGGLLDVSNLPKDGDAKHNVVVLAFRLNDAERERIFMSNADVYVTLLTFGNPMQPITVHVGKEEIAQHFGLRTVED